MGVLLSAEVWRHEQNDYVNQKCGRSTHKIERLYESTKRKPKKTNVCSRENKKIWYETEKTKKTLENIT